MTKQQEDFTKNLREVVKDAVQTLEKKITTRKNEILPGQDKIIGAMGFGFQGKGQKAC